MEKIKSSNHVTRRHFLKTVGISSGLSLSGITNASTLNFIGYQMETKNITIKKVDSNFEREPLIRPFGFKGGYMSEIWQTIAYMQSESGFHKIGLCTQNVLWSDAKVFASFSESGGNALMYSLTDYALKIANGMSFKTPIDLLDALLPEVYEYGKKQKVEGA